jgi:hypothetical protein
MSVPICLETFLLCAEVAMLYRASVSACRFLLASDIDVKAHKPVFPELGYRNLMFDSSKEQYSVNFLKFTPSSQKERDIEVALILNAASIGILQDTLSLYCDVVSSRRFFSTRNVIKIEQALVSLEQRYQSLMIDDLDEQSMIKRHEPYFQESQGAETGSTCSTTADLFALVEEYKQLSGLPKLSDKNADRIALILELAQLDSELHQQLKSIDAQIYSQVEEWL